MEIRLQNGIICIQSSREGPQQAILLQLGISFHHVVNAINPIEKYEKWANCSQIPIIDIISKDSYKKYFDQLNQVVGEMREAQRMAEVLKAKIHNALGY